MKATESEIVVEKRAISKRAGNRRGVPCFFAAFLVAGSSVFGAVRIAEVCPRPGVADEAGKESGWVVLVNDGAQSENLADYELVRANRGKKLEAGKASKNLAPAVLAPGENVKIWTSEEYPNCKDLGGSGNVEVFDGRMVYPNKVNPKKFPFVALYDKADAAVLADAVAVPVDIPDGWRMVRDFDDASHYAWHITDGTTEIPCGPVVGPLYGVKHSESDLAATAPAVPGEAYSVELAVNPFSGSALPGDAIAAVQLEYNCDFGETKSVAMASAGTDKSKGALWRAQIPAADIPTAPGRLIRWRAKITDGAGNVWTAPAFNNPDDGYAWYGTITEPGELADSKLQTWHMFVEGAGNLAQMDVDADRQDLSLVPYNARCSIYDSQTGFYYDNVRIDLRGNTSGGFRKKSHGLRFAKCLPMKCVNPFDGEEIETRKTSLVAEYCDPAYVRQSLAFWLLRSVGAYAPFHYPVRVNLNGEFYQLAFHSNRFSDEMIEDWYGFDETGYGYKNCGTLAPTIAGDRLSGSTVVCEKKTPDDGVETGWAALAPLAAWTSRFGAAANGAEDIAAVSRAVVATFDLPAWLNYLAATRITMECDDSYANLSCYGDVNGTGTWKPLAYDMNQSWGHIYNGQWNGQKIVPGEVMASPYAEEDRYKAHPFYGGRRIISHDAAGHDDNRPNYAFEAIYQSATFRRLYLRRLRTLMDEWLGAPGTPKEETRVWQYVVAITNATRECAALDYAKWRAHKSNPAAPGTFWTETGTFCWTGKITHDQGVEDLWVNYIEPRRRHLFETHSIHNTSKGVGYGASLSAGIPDAQGDAAALAAKFRVAGLTGDELRLVNTSDEAVDVSGWGLGGAVDGVLPGGTVVDAGGTLTVVRDRISWVAANMADLGERMVVGNFDFTGEGGVTLQPRLSEESGGGANSVSVKGFGREMRRWFDAAVQNAAAGASGGTAGIGEPEGGAWSLLGEERCKVGSRQGWRSIELVGDAAAGDGLKFALERPGSTRRKAVVELVAAFDEAVLTTDDAPAARAGVTLVRMANGAPSFAVCGDGRWLVVSNPSVAPSEGVAQRIRLDFDFNPQGATVRYSVHSGAGWAALADENGRTRFGFDGDVTDFEFLGTGEIADFCGDWPGTMIYVR